MSLSANYELSGLSYTFHAGLNRNMSNVFARILNTINGIDDKQHLVLTEYMPYRFSSNPLCWLVIVVVVVDVLIVVVCCL